jgi:hypothetical protein
VRNTHPHRPGPLPQPKASTPWYRSNGYPIRCRIDAIGVDCVGMLTLAALLLSLLLQNADSGNAWSGGPPQVDPADRHRLVWAGSGGANTSFYPVGFYPAIDAVTHQQPAELDLFHRALNDMHAQAGINYMRQLFTIGQPAGPTPLPYQLIGGSSNVVNLSRWNPTLFSVWNRLLAHAAARGVVVQICILDAWHNKQMVTDFDRVHGPFGLKYDFYFGGRNVNDVNASTPEDWVDPSQPVFATQKALVAKVVSELGHHPNIIWEVANEPSEHNGKYLAWLSELAAHITATETSLGLARHLVIPRDIPGHQNTAGHWNANDNVSTVHSQLVEMWKQQDVAPQQQPQPLLADDDCGGVTPPAVYARQRAWAALTAGAQSSFLNITIRDRITLQTAAVRAGMEAVGSVTRFLTHEMLHVQLRGMEPSDHLVSTGWCLARPPSSTVSILPPEVIVFLRGGQGSTSVKREALRNWTSYAAHWFSAESGEVQQAVGAAGTFTRPEKGDWALHIVQRSRWHDISQ